jgi:hypothetical protein
MEGEYVSQNESPDYSEPFDEMAASIKHNKGQGFGGACVIVPPGGENTISLLLLDGAQDPAQFFALVKTKCEIALNAIDDKHRQAGGFPARR